MSLILRKLREMQVLSMVFVNTSFIALVSGLSLPVLLGPLSLPSWDYLLTLVTIGFVSAVGNAFHIFSFKLEEANKVQLVYTGSMILFSFLFQIFIFDVSAFRRLRKMGHIYIFFLNTTRDIC